MHAAPRSIYNHDVDFRALAFIDADFKKHLKTNGQLNFSDAAAVRYPIDIDPKNHHFATQNIARNNLTSRIRPLLTKPDGPLIPLDALGIESLDFQLCNPPFYPSPTSLALSASLKTLPPSSACTAAPVETITPGGETAFAARLVAESARLRTRVQWYTTMLGKLSSVAVVVEGIKAAGVRNWAVREFVNGEMSAGGGGRTRRWGVGWSWGNRRPAVRAARGVGEGSGVGKGTLPFPGEYGFWVPGGGGGGVVEGRLEGVMEGVEGRWGWRREGGVGVGFVKGNVWGRKARRRRGRLEEGVEEEEEESGGEEVGEMALGFKIVLRVGEEGDGVEVKVRWLQGVDSVLFESFCGMLRREMLKGG
ncbi:MAG: hypothetical protein Q9202_001994 [Teloschistes flavicans]